MLFHILKDTVLVSKTNHILCQQQITAASVLAALWLTGLTQVPQPILVPSHDYYLHPSIL
ncbi:hypothetical protein I79_015819 [Cricetulus griseus]|uniref:Uncharacterized protein n=1 Tax=Cricetulus griseus TaxID=10029 RepID=G3HXQ7_CRIGR|nr:hypothetical protein I79_015819 [Cricetulus griseus]